MKLSSECLYWWHYITIFFFIFGLYPWSVESVLKVLKYHIILLITYLIHISAVRPFIMQEFIICFG
jgi:hypothetical protein